MITVFAYDEPNLKGKKHEGLSGPIVGGFTQSVDVETWGKKNLGKLV